jgi:hypothetical protein
MKFDEWNPKMYFAAVAMEIKSGDFNFFLFLSSNFIKIIIAGYSPNRN